MRQDFQCTPSKSVSCLHHPDIKHKLATQSLWQASPILICIQSANDWQLSAGSMRRAAVVMHNASWGLKSYLVRTHGRLKYLKIFKSLQRKNENKVDVLSRESFWDTGFKIRGIERSLFAEDSSASRNYWGSNWSLNYKCFTKEKKKKQKTWIERTLPVLKQKPLHGQQSWNTKWTIFSDLPILLESTTQHLVHQ